MNLTLRVWRQKSAQTSGKFATYQARNVIPDMSFLEMLDVVNQDLILRGEEPIAFDSDCREGICGMCSIVINGIPHGGHKGTTVCQLHMRHFRDGETIVIERKVTPGMPAMPLSWEEVTEKFRRCAAGVISDDAQHKVIEAVAQIDTLPSVRPLLQALVPER